jgi:hypothetical protein
MTDLALDPFAEYALARSPAPGRLTLEVGADPGKLSDPCALVLYSLDGSRRLLRQARRLPLGTRHDDVADRLARWAISTARTARELTLYLDATGVGEAVWERLQRRLLGGSVGLIPLVITAGAGGPHRQAPERGRPLDPRVHVAKRWLIESALEPALNTGAIRAAAGCGDLLAVQQQLNAFRATGGEGGSVAYGAKAGQHDDLVLAASYPLIHQLPVEGGDLSGLGLLGDGRKLAPELDSEFTQAEPSERWL